MPTANIPNNSWFTGGGLAGAIVNLFKVSALGFRVLLTDRIFKTITPVDIDAQNGTLLAASVASGLIVHTSAVGGGTLTFDTGANYAAQFPDMPIGSALEFVIVNDGNQTDTLAVAAGVTIANVAQTIAANESAIVMLRKTAAATYVAYIVGA